ncbi:MAG: HAMP domain-containing sensor histidine kinase [Patescibacteria group bacterium]
MNTSPSSDKKPRLPGFRAATHLVALGVGIFYIVLIYLGKDSLSILRYKEIVVGALLFAFVYTGIFRLLGKKFKWEKQYYIFNFGWIPVYVGIVYGTGGAKSPLLFLFLVPILTTAWNLDAVITKRVAFVMLAIAALIPLADPQYLRTSGFILEHFIIVSAMGVVMYYIYKLLNETLLQKYEKEEAKKKYDELMEVDRLKTDFVTMVSHQLRTPLTGVRWGLSALSEKENLSGKDKILIKQTQEKVSDSINIVDGIINSVESGAGIFQKEWGAVNLGEIIKKASDNLRHTISVNKVVFKINENSSCVVNGNKEILSSALLNIMDNAVHYTPGGTVTVDITSEGSNAVIRVADNGIGISSDDQPHIFERFYRSKNAMSVEPSGSGIGLYISKRIIERHGGDITISSVLKKGTVVTVRIPLIK